MTTFDLFRHQSQILRLPWEKPNIPNHFLVAGYAAGKSTADTVLMHEITRRYWKYPIQVGIGSTTITLLKKTVIADYERSLIESGASYRYNRSENVLQVGQLKYILLATGQPQEIYGHNLSIFLNDEMDELEQTKAIEADTAIQERTRVSLPDGRDPFTVSTTTAQGYKGTYQIIEDLKERGEPYALVRGKTSDNTSLPKNYLDRLYALYDENERLAYLEGRFVNLTAGRVYPGYDEDHHLNHGLQHIQNHERVFVGQDMNEGYSKGVAAIVRDGVICIDKTFSFKAIGMAPSIMRNTWPVNSISWVPDNSGKPILGGYTDEVEQHGIEVVWTGRNPSILDRIFIVNKLFQLGKLVLGPDCHDLSMALKTRQFDKKGVPEKGQGEKAPDHICDGFEYLIFWIVANEPEFMDLYELTPSSRKAG